LIPLQEANIPSSASFFYPFYRLWGLFPVRDGLTMNVFFPDQSGITTAEKLFVKPIGHEQYRLLNGARL
jgi:hypothetical protein